MNNQPQDEGYPSFLDVLSLVMNSKFRLGSIYATGNALSLIEPTDAFKALERHSQCDWGNIDPEDNGLNEIALVEGSRLLSVYKDRYGETFWIITEADRSSTTVLLPEDY